MRWIISMFLFALLKEGVLKLLIPKRHRDEFYNLLLPEIPPPNQEKPK